MGSLKYIIPQQDFDVEDNFLITKRDIFSPGIAVNYTSEMDISKFYKDFIHYLTYNKSVFCKDFVGTEEQLKDFSPFENVGKIGTHIFPGNDNLQRLPAYDKFNIFRELPNGNYEMEFYFEITIPAKYAKKSGFVIGIELVTRSAKKIERIIGNQKITTYFGKWENRSSYTYFSKSLKETIPIIDKIPFVKSFDFLRRKLVKAYLLYLKEGIENDITFCEKKIIPGIQGYLNKQFGRTSSI